MRLFFPCVESQVWLDLIQALWRREHVVEVVWAKELKLGTKLLASHLTHVSSLSFLVKIAVQIA